MLLLELIGGRVPNVCPDSILKALKIQSTIYHVTVAFFGQSIEACSIKIIHGWLSLL